MLPPGVNFTIFYEQLFQTNVFCAAFMCLQFGFVICCQKDFGAKAAHKMLVKLTPGVNVIKLFLSLICGFSLQARVFIPGKPLQPILTYTLAY
jgi:hypothetical protein